MQLSTPINDVQVYALETADESGEDTADVDSSSHATSSAQSTEASTQSQQSSKPVSNGSEATEVHKHCPVI